jgi:Ni,Fe-hydrogenase III large subunit
MVLSMLVAVEHRDSAKSKKNAASSAYPVRVACYSPNLPVEISGRRQADVTEKARVKPRELAQASAVLSLMLQQHPNGLQSAHDTEVQQL